ncbi:114aa long hypothetical protein [Pyrococcus horikoshii OT3]|uniref:Uncharacterized protein n=1 Tax=Pyrococcus horikoshii (strain ATCC 700860 / DSM 12428 / JCM 9974 / NBRC 100139 / OT-3) TaxID=70601 RepID=O58228_PYRHO|nr:114aa long hypothetical protein [Pyrococcus horikoshii OT3]
MTLTPSLVASTASLISSVILSMMLFMLSAACLLSSANFLISWATTANPLPASPALAASIAAFKANKFVCSAMLVITLVISSMFLLISETLDTVSSILDIMCWISSILFRASSPF